MGSCMGTRGDILGIGTFCRATKGEHSETIAFISEPVEREVCQACGNVTTRFKATITGDIDRLVSRRADTTRAR